MATDKERAASAAASEMQHRTAKPQGGKDTTAHAPEITDADRERASKQQANETSERWIPPEPQRGPEEGESHLKGGDGGQLTSQGPWKDPGETKPGPAEPRKAEPGHGIAAEAQKEKA
jgi:hypothetical protein